MNEPAFEDRNARRRELIIKEHRGFSNQERARPFTVPGWREECERRYAENLTPEEHQELQQLQDDLDRQLSSEFPRSLSNLKDVLAELEGL